MLPGGGKPWGGRSGVRGAHGGGRLDQLTQGAGCRTKSRGSLQVGEGGDALPLWPPAADRGGVAVPPPKREGRREHPQATYFWHLYPARAAPALVSSVRTHPVPFPAGFSALKLCRVRNNTSHLPDSLGPSHSRMTRAPLFTATDGSRNPVSIHSSPHASAPVSVYSCVQAPAHDGEAQTPPRPRAHSLRGGTASPPRSAAGVHRGKASPPSPTCSDPRLMARHPAPCVSWSRRPPPWAPLTPLRPP